MRHEKKNRVMDDFKIWKNVLLDGDWERSMGGVGNQEFHFGHVKSEMPKDINVD